MSRSARITSWLTERSLKKAVCEASLWIPLISFAARVSAAVMLAPFLAGRHRAPQFHAVGHARCYAGPEDEQFRHRTQVLAAQDQQPLMQCHPAVDRSSCLLSGPAYVRLKAQP